MELLLISNDNLLELRGLQDATDLSYVNDATVSATLTDLDGNAVSGQGFPVTLNYVAASNGIYRATLQDGLALRRGKIYQCTVDAVSGGGITAQFVIRARALDRYE